MDKENPDYFDECLDGCPRKRDVEASHEMMNSHWPGMFTRKDLVFCSRTSLCPTRAPEVEPVYSHKKKATMSDTLALRPIQTRYNGYMFRSRLEARWAVFFSALGLRWEYEPEGFDLGDNELYLPDFRVRSPQEMVTWYEIKPVGVEFSGKLERFRELVRASPEHSIDADSFPENSSALLLVGDPGYVLFERVGEDRYYVCPRCGQVGQPWTTPQFTYQWSTDWSYACGSCDRDTPCGGGHPAEAGLLAPVMPYKGSLLIHPTHGEQWLRRVEVAVNAARATRFEFAEGRSIAGVRR